MYQNIKQNIRNRLILWTTILTILGLLCLVYSILRIKLFPHLFAFSSILLGIGGIFLIAAILYPTVNLLRLRKLKAILSVNSDIDMEQFLMRGEPLSREDTPMAYLVHDRIVNFDSLRTYTLDRVAMLRTKAYENSDSCNATFSVQVKISGSLRKDDLLFKDRNDRDAVFETLRSACAGYTDISRFH